MIAQALQRGKRTTWSVIMLGGGHFAAAIFESKNFLPFACFTPLKKHLFLIKFRFYLLLNIYSCKISLVN